MLVHLWKPFHHIVSYYKGSMPFKGECIVHSMSLTKNIYFPSKVCAIWRPFHHTIQPHCQTSWVLSANMCLHAFLYHSCAILVKSTETGKEIDFTHRILDLPLIYLATVNLSKGIYETLDHNRKKGEIPPCDSQACKATPLEVFSVHVLKIVFLKLLDNCQETTHYIKWFQ